MSKKLRVLKVSKGGTDVVGPSAAVQEAMEFAKVGADLVEVFETNKKHLQK